MAKSNHESPTFTRKTSISTKGQVNMARKHIKTPMAKQVWQKEQNAMNKNKDLNTQ